MNQEQLEFLKTLAPPDPLWQGMGASPLSADPRDYPLSLIPQVGALLAAGAPDSADLSALFAGPSYNQGNTPACVAYSTAGLGSMDDYANDHAWSVFAALQMYQAAGGSGSNGVDTRLVLQQAVENGLPYLDGSGRQKVIGSYAFAPQVPGAFRETLKAALAAGQPCTLALLLPANFGWESSGSITSGYHQVIACSYDSRWCGIKNSWGDGWGRNGFGRVEWDYLEQNNLQQRYSYAYTVTALALPAPLPTPIPTPAPLPVPAPVPTAITIAAKLGGGLNLSSVVVGPGYTLQGHGLAWPLEVTQVNGPTPSPAPVPSALQVNLARQGLFVYITLQDKWTGAYLSGTVVMVTGGSIARARTTVVGRQVYPALARATGTGPLSVTLKADDGRMGTGAG